MLRRSLGQSGHSGMTLIEVLIAFSLLMVLGLGLAAVMDQMNKGQIRSNVTAEAQTIRANALEILSSEQGWHQTLADPGNKTFECLRSGTDCSAFKAEGPGREFILRDAADQAYLDGLQSKLGFTAAGQRCEAFPTDGCPFKMELSWRALCPASGVCVSPQIEVIGKLRYEPVSAGRKTPFNSERHGFKVIKSLPAGIPLPAPQKAQAAAAGELPVLNWPKRPDSAAETPSPEELQRSACAIFEQSSSDPKAVQQIRERLKAMGMETLIENCDN